MAGRDGGGPLVWIGGAILAAGAAVIAGFWVYGITQAEDMSTLLLAALLAVPVGMAVLLVAVIRDRIIDKRRENFPEVDN